MITADLVQVVERDSAGVNRHKSVFVYDGFSRKVISKEYSWDSASSTWVLSNETRRIYDGPDVVQERDGSNSVKVNYTRDGNIGGILARTVKGTGGAADAHYYYHYDGSGNVVQLTDAGQNTVAAYHYDAYGNLLSVSGPQSGQPYRYSTKEYHAALGLYDYGFRFYNPSLGRWINRDPIREAGGLNLYGFVGNNPVNYVDTNGLIRIEVRFTPAIYINGAYHSTIIVWDTDKAGNKVGCPRFFRGGWQPMGSTKNSNSTSGDHDLLHVLYGYWTPNAIDWGGYPYKKNGKEWHMIILDDPKRPSAAKFIQNCKRIASRIERAKLNYGGYGYNSNSVTTTLLSRGLGIDLNDYPNPPFMTPGWGNKLPIKW